MTTTVAPERQNGRASQAAEGFSIICLSRQDWESRLPTNRQQIMSRVAARGHEVVFVETGHFVGSRAAQWLKGRDPSFLRRLISSERIDEGLRVRRAVNLLPWGQRFRFSAAINRRLTALAVARQVRRLPKPVVLWIYDPVAFARPGCYGEDIAVYDVVDDYAEQVGPERRALVTAADIRAAGRSRVVFATTSALRDRHVPNNASTHLVRNVGDFAHFSRAAEPSFAAADLPTLTRPVLGFVGNFVTSKVDFDLLEGLASKLPEASLLLVGPTKGAAEERLVRLMERSNVHWVGFRPYADVPRYVAAFDVALIPYVENEYTRSCFPLKLFEYLAAAKPVVASGLPELRGFEPDVVVAGGVDEFVAGVRAALSLDTDKDRARRVALAAANTWDSRTDRLLSLVSEALGGD